MKFSSYFIHLIIFNFI